MMWRSSNPVPGLLGQRDDQRPDVSVSSVRVSETVTTATFNDIARGPAMLDHGLAHVTISVSCCGQRILSHLTNEVEAGRPIASGGGDPLQYGSGMESEDDDSRLAIDGRFASSSRIE